MVPLRDVVAHEPTRHARHYNEPRSVSAIDALTESSAEPHSGSVRIAEFWTPAEAFTQAVPVLAADLVPGRRYAVREEPHRGGPLLEAQFVGPARAGKAKVRWLEGERDGLEEWLATRWLICPWAERKAFLLDEQHAAAIKAASQEMDDVVVEAVSAVMEASGESGRFWREWWDPPDRVRRLWARAALSGDPLTEPLAYADRHGRAHLSAHTALLWARAFAAAEPETVGLFVNDE